MGGESEIIDPWAKAKPINISVTHLGEKIHLGEKHLYYVLQKDPYILFCLNTSSREACVLFPCLCSFVSKCY